MKKTYQMSFIDHNGDYYDIQTGERTKQILENSHKKCLAIVISCEEAGVIK